jgi:anti-anti-sigma regulatory factor
MVLSESSNLLHEILGQGVHVVRFVRPDLRAQLEEDGDGCPLGRELQAVVDTLDAGETLVLNLALIEPFPTDFYSCLLRARKAVRDREVRLILCRLSPELLELFKLFNAHKLFHVTVTEAQALRCHPDSFFFML